MDFNKTKPEVWLNQSHDILIANVTTDEWFILNIQETGTDLNIYKLCFVCIHVRMFVCVCVCAYVMDHF
jgi:hypothetical protein